MILVLELNPVEPIATFDMYTAVDMSLWYANLDTIDVFSIDTSIAIRAGTAVLDFGQPASALEVHAVIHVTILRVDFQALYGTAVDSCVSVGAFSIIDNRRQPFAINVRPIGDVSSITCG